jgi:hypothetical protein
MSGNIGTIDQFIRSLVGFALIAYLAKSAEFPPAFGPLLLVAIYLYVTAIFRYCPTYRLAGFSTVGELGGNA